jgi:putative DNA primase/helicase
MTDIHQFLEAKLSSSDIRNDSLLRPADYTDEALAARFTDQYGQDLKYVNGWGRWFVWDGKRWSVDETLRVANLCRVISREALLEIVKAGGARSLVRAVGSASTVSAIERLARADRTHATSSHDWDSDPWLLNTPDGTVDLKTGQILPHTRSDLITKITSVTPGGDCPRWMRFLDRIFDGDEELIRYVQRMVGYGLTASTREHALFFFHGTGGNGKGVFLNTITGILGDYAVTAPMATFTASNNDRHPTELAMLRGARIVTAQETESGQRWAEAKIKTLTGGDPISARFMRQDFFTFQPLFKLLIAGNHKPSLKSVDEAVRRRFNLIPFTVTIPPAERDPELAEELKQEWPGILDWAIEGCLEWQRIGLAPPSVILDATKEYLDEEDAIGRFIKEKCDLADKSASEDVSDLYNSYKEWCDAFGERPISTKRFSQNLSDRKIQKGQNSKTRRALFRGIRLLERPRPKWEASENVPAPSPFRSTNKMFGDFL